MIRPFVATATLSLALSTTTLAQTQTDFNGRWTSEARPDSAAGRGAGPGGGGGGAGRAGGGGGAGRGGQRAGDMGSGWGTTITIEQNAAKLSVEYAFFSRGDMQAPLKFNYALDGSETKNTVMMGRGFQDEFSRTSWDGSKLVITTTYTFPHPATGAATKMQVKRVLSLESPTSLVVETTRDGVMGGAPTSTRTVYTKIP